MLSLDSVSFRSGDRVLLDAVSFSLAPGQFYGVIGHNGAGKSTLIRLLGGELLPSSGAVLLDGAAVHAFSAKARARRIASLPQKLPDAADFLVRELVMLGRFPWQGWLQRPSRRMSPVWRRRWRRRMWRVLPRSRSIRFLAASSSGRGRDCAVGAVAAGAL